MLRLLRARFGGQVDAYIEYCVATAHDAHLGAWARGMLSASTIPELLNDLRRNQSTIDKWADLPHQERKVMAVGERPFEQGEERGFRLGFLLGQRRTLLRQLRCRFGSQLDAAAELRIAAATDTQLETWVERVLSATTIAELLAD